MSAELAMYSGLIFYPICLIGFVIIVISLIRIAVSLNQIKNCKIILKEKRTNK